MHRRKSLNHKRILGILLALSILMAMLAMSASAYTDYDEHHCTLTFLYEDFPAVLPVGEVGVAYNVQINAEGCAEIIFVNWEDSLPPGLTISESGRITGTPTTEGTFNFRLGAQIESDPHYVNSNGWSFTIDVIRRELVELSVFKTDENGLPLGGAIMMMQGHNDAEVPRVYTAASNALGVATFIVETGTYILSEFAAPEGYNATDDSYTIFVLRGGYVQLDMGPNMNPALYEPVTFVNRLIPTLNKEDHFAYLRGNGGMFRPADNMTRAEAVVMFSRLLNESMNMTVNHRNNFYPDVQPTNWFANEVGYMQQLGVLAHFSRDGNFRPNDPVTRAEFAVLATHFDNLTLIETNEFIDVPNDHWAVKFINSAADRGWIRGSGGMFRPEDGINRAEVATLVNRMLDRRADADYLAANISTLPRTYSDIAPGHYAYWAVMEASISHDYIRSAPGVETWTGTTR